MPVIELGYTPRWYQQEIHDALDVHRFGVLCLHRRAGKTVLAIQELIKRVLLCDKPNAYGAYICPTYKQAKMVAWTMLKDSMSAIPGVAFNEVELRADLQDKRIQLLGAESYDRLRGIFLDFVVLDEYALMPSAAWGTVIRPALADRQGRALFISTPRGHNAFYELYREAEEMPDWYTRRLKYTDTNIIDAAEIEAMRKEMSAAEFEQEMNCSWQAAIRGAYYGEEMTLAEDEGRVTRVPYDKTLPVITSWDLGVNDATVIWFWQLGYGGDIKAIDCRAYQGTGLPDIVRDLQQLPYKYSQHIGPHDLGVKELGSGLTRMEIASNLGVTFDIAPKQPVLDGIHAVRGLIPRMWFDREKCAKGVEALKQYRTEYDERKGIFRNTPLHDWTSDFADSVRYFAVTPHRGTMRTRIRKPSARSSARAA